MVTRRMHSNIYIHISDTKEPQTKTAHNGKLVLDSSFKIHHKYGYGNTICGGTPE